MRFTPRAAATAVALSFVCTASAAPYIGTAAPCSALSTSTCRVDVLQFMKTKYSYNGYTLNYDNHTDSTQNSLRAASYRQIYRPAIFAWEYVTGNSLPFGLAQHQTISNAVIYLSTTQGTAKSLGYYSWGTGDVNALHVMSEISFQDTSNSWFKTFTGANTSYSQDDFQNRGYYWTDYSFDVTPIGGGVFVGPTRDKPAHGYLDFNYANVLLHERWDAYNAAALPGDTSGAKMVATVNFYPNFTDSNVLNKGAGSLPSTLEVLKVTHTRKSSNGTVMMWESYYYGRQRLTNGTYNYFGEIFYESGARDTNICLNGVPSTAHPFALCDSATNTYYAERSTFGGFVFDTPATKYAQALAVTYKNDPKFTKRTAQDSYGNVQEHSFKPNNRGGFRPQGAGADSTGNLVLNTDMVYLESNGADQDVYLFVAGQDPVSSTQPTPPNYCRSGYQFVGSIVTAQSYSVIKYGGGVRGDWYTNPGSGSIGTMMPASGTQVHWISFCATSNSTGPMMYINAGNAGEESCSAGYTPRLWFNANHSGVTACPIGGGCFDGIAKNYINMCVKSSQCVGSCAASSNP